jgi:hypothetical protein
MTTQATPNIDPNAFLMGGGSASAKFEEYGDTVTGTICEAPEVRQQTDISTGQPVHWPSGDPKMQLIVTLQTTLRDDPDDDGKRRVYVKGKSLTEAVREAVRQTGAKGLELGGTLTVTYTGDGVASQRGFNPPKLYTATYARPDTAAQSGQFLGVQPAQQAPAAAQPAAPAPAQAGPTQQQIDALKAAGVDPKTVFPGYNPPPF